MTETEYKQVEQHRRNRHIQAWVGYVAVRIHAHLPGADYSHIDCADMCTTMAMDLVGEDASDELRDKIDVWSAYEDMFYYDIGEALEPLFEMSEEELMKKYEINALYQADASVFREYIDKVLEEYSKRK